jgi:hypothetical protein
VSKIGVAVELRARRRDVDGGETTANRPSGRPLTNRARFSWPSALSRQSDAGAPASALVLTAEALAPYTREVSHEAKGGVVCERPGTRSKGHQTGH